MPLYQLRQILLVPAVVRAALSRGPQVVLRKVNYEVILLQPRRLAKGDWCVCGQERVCVLAREGLCERERAWVCIWARGGVYGSGVERPCGCERGA